MTPIILVKQDHKADRAGRHTDWRVVVGDKALSWATKKPDPKIGEKLILWEQPVHDAHYALSKKVVIPKGQYGAGTTKLVYAQKGEGKLSKDEIHLKLNNGDDYFIKKTPNYGDKAWLLVKTASQMEVATDDDLAKLIHSLLLMRPIQGASAEKAYKALSERNLLTLEDLRNVDFEDLRHTLKSNGYGRFDIKTSHALKDLVAEGYPISLPRKNIGPKTLEHYSRKT
jgi:hypothetical protein